MGRKTKVDRPFEFLGSSSVGETGMKTQAAKMSPQELAHFRQVAEGGGSGGFTFGHVRLLIGHILALEVENEALRSQPTSNAEPQAAGDVHAVSVLHST